MAEQQVRRDVDESRIAKHYGAGGQAPPVHLLPDAPADTFEDRQKRVRCGNCGRLIWRVLRECTCRSDIEHKCQGCASILLVTGGRSVVITTPGTR